MQRRTDSGTVTVLVPDHQSFAVVLAMTTGLRMAVGGGAGGRYIHTDDRVDRFSQIQQGSASGTYAYEQRPRMARPLPIDSSHSLTTRPVDW